MDPAAGVSAGPSRWRFCSVSLGSCAGIPARNEGCAEFRGTRPSPHGSQRPVQRVELEHQYRGRDGRLREGGRSSHLSHAYAWDFSSSLLPPCSRSGTGSISHNLQVRKSRRVQLWGERTGAILRPETQCSGFWGLSVQGGAVCPRSYCLVMLAPP